ncbi:hypothetical protein TBLA_0C01480 [Henningerozyma blattae CBS 6284]|uniref:J domain-containing protein n=1 Tax=Henningerozyma blattae (strain ATCC 34711 / CBS 6284 / DSM 70876 / NBRC 10599 / NRRL Y-10934 / UCD 77-7) TaxID=1071380 RepID=I2H0R1_HENB6|nr:hypothetical protein TBLA_0C01480 [Tetrapisispora blattae CBS 6284]CCH59963.1 hypothetical protein TBLA_0C01480 [Tetrapisispora blattae CBS 6284]
MVKETKLYDLLGVSSSASDAEIKKGYRKAALKYHPDKPTGDTEKFKEISEAFEILSDSNKRSVYDQYGLDAARNGGPSFQGQSGFPGGGGSTHSFSNDDAFNIFSQFFGSNDSGFSGFSSGFPSGAGGARFSSSGFPGGMGGMPGGMGSMPGGMGGMPAGMGGMPGGMPGGFSSASPHEEEVVSVDIPVSLEDLFTGKKKSFKIGRKGMRGEPEKVQIDINLKPGWKEGTKLTYKNHGDYNPSTGGRKTLQFIIKEKKHPLYKRDGDNIIYTLPLTFKESLLGFSKTLQTLDGRTLPLSRSQPVQPTEENTYPGQGMPISKNPGQRGNLIIKYKINYPISLTDSQRRAIADNF